MSSAALPGPIDGVKSGFEKLLELHDAVEVSSLATALGLSSDGAVDFIRKEVAAHLAQQAGDEDDSGKTYSDTLGLVWEGVLYQYLQMVGQPRQSRRLDPKASVVQYWRQKVREAQSRDFLPVFLQQEAEKGALAAVVSVDDEIAGILGDLRTKERDVKHWEEVIRRDHNYKHVAAFFLSSQALREAERTHRDSLIQRLQTEHAKHLERERSLKSQLADLWDQRKEEREILTGRLEIMSRSTRKLWSTLTEKLLLQATLIRDVGAFLSRPIDLPQWTQPVAPASVSTSESEATPEGEEAARSKATSEATLALLGEMSDDEETSPQETLPSVQGPKVPLSAPDAFARAIQRLDAEIHERDKVVVLQNETISSQQEELAGLRAAVEEERRRGALAERSLEHWKKRGEEVEKLFCEELASRVLGGVLQEQLSQMHLQAKTKIEELANCVGAARPLVEQLLLSPNDENRALGWSFVSSLALAHGDELEQLRNRVLMHDEEQLARRMKARKGRSAARKGTKGKTAARKSKKSPTGSSADMRAKRPGRKPAK